MSAPHQGTCPHCGSPLRPLQLPDTSGWEHGCDLVCFDDDCPYYVRGWTWMQSRFGVSSSYRYRVNPQTGSASPIGVWSPSALRNLIVATPASGENGRA